MMAFSEIMHALENDRPTKQNKNILGPEATQCIGPEWNRAQAAECVCRQKQYKLREKEGSAVLGFEPRTSWRCTGIANQFNYNGYVILDGFRNRRTIFPNCSESNTVNTQI